MKEHKGMISIATLLLALLLAIFLLPVMTGLITQGQIKRQPTVIATPEPDYKDYEEQDL